MGVMWVELWKNQKLINLDYLFFFLLYVSQKVYVFFVLLLITIFNFKTGGID